MKILFSRNTHHYAIQYDDCTTPIALYRPQNVHVRYLHHEISKTSPETRRLLRHVTMRLIKHGQYIIAVDPVPLITLEHLIKQHRNFLTETNIRRIFYAVTVQIKNLHAQGVLHHNVHSHKMFFYRKRCKLGLGSYYEMRDLDMDRGTYLIDNKKDEDADIRSLAMLGLEMMGCDVYALDTIDQGKFPHYKYFSKYTYTMYSFFKRVYECKYGREGDCGYMLASNILEDDIFKDVDTSLKTLLEDISSLDIAEKRGINPYVEDEDESEGRVTDKSESSNEEYEYETSSDEYMHKKDREALQRWADEAYNTPDRFSGNQYAAFNSAGVTQFTNNVANSNIANSNKNGCKNIVNGNIVASNSIIASNSNVANSIGNNYTANSNTASQNSSNFTTANSNITRSTTASQSTSQSNTAINSVSSNKVYTCSCNQAGNKEDGCSICKQERKIESKEEEQKIRELKIEEAKRKVEEENKRIKEQKIRELKIEEENKKKIEEEAKRKIEEENKRIEEQKIRELKVEEENKRKIEEEAKRKAEEDKIKERKEEEEDRIKKRMEEEDKIEAEEEKNIKDRELRIERLKKELEELKTINRRKEELIKSEIEFTVKINTDLQNIRKQAELAKNRGNKTTIVLNENEEICNICNFKRDKVVKPANGVKLNVPGNLVVIKEPDEKTKPKEPSDKTGIKVPDKNDNINEPTNKTGVKESLNTIQQKEPTNKTRVKEPDKNDNKKELINVIQQKEPTNKTRIKEPDKNDNKKEPINVIQQKEPTNKTGVKENDKINQTTNKTGVREPLNVIQQKEPLNIIGVKEPKNTTGAKEPLNMIKTNEDSSNIKEPKNITKTNETINKTKEASNLAKEPDDYVKIKEAIKKQEIVEQRILPSAVNKSNDFTFPKRDLFTGVVTKKGRFEISENVSKKGHWFSTENGKLLRIVELQKRLIFWFKIDNSGKEFEEQIRNTENELRSLGAGIDDEIEAYKSNTI